MFQNAKNSRKKGNIGVGHCIQYFTELCAVVLIPLDDSQDYDLVVDYEGKLQKVQVKTTEYFRHGVFIACLKTCGGNKSRNSMKLFDKTSVDLLFILTSDNKKYLIPSEEIEATTSINLGKKYDKYLI